MSSVIKGTRPPSKWVDNEILFKGNLDIDTYNQILDFPKNDWRKVRTKRCRKNVYRGELSQDVELNGLFLPEKTTILIREKNNMRCEIVHGLNGYRIHVF